MWVLTKSPIIMTRTGNGDRIEMMPSVGIPHTDLASPEFRDELGRLMTIGTHTEILRDDQWCSFLRVEKTECECQFLTVMTQMTFLLLLGHLVQHGRCLGNESSNLHLLPQIGKMGTDSI